MNSPAWQNHTLGPCACSQLRRTARAVTSLYDTALAPSGLTVTQYALLVNVARTEGISRTALADKLGMERTTLTRNLRPLENHGLIAETPGADRRSRTLTVTASGRRQVEAAFVLWQNVQQDFLLRLGPTAVQDLRNALQSAEQASKI